jgi:hypothetical protein
MAILRQRVEFGLHIYDTFWITPRGSFHGWCFRPLGRGLGMSRRIAANIATAARVFDPLRKSVLYS